MYLKRLDVQGFKTFAQRTTFVFDRGITAIVGANGSGKSNLADAIRWVLGEQTVRLLRARRAEDVIFAGSAKRPPLGMAEVILTLDNGDSAIPLDTTEVSIGRRLYRDGESEYLINGRRVRHRDVVDLLVRANLGQNAFSIISQGMVDAALSLRPIERRTLIEESTDIKRHQQRMAESQDKLQTTLANMDRVHDLLSELRPQLDRLAEQADRARRYQERRRALLDLVREQYRREWNRLTTAYQAAIAQRDERQRLLTAAEEELRRALATQQRTRSALAERQANLAEQRQALDAATSKLGKLDANLALLEEREQSSNTSLAELERERGWLEGELTAAEQQHQAAAARVAALAAESDEAIAAAERASAELDRRESERQALRREIAAQTKAAAAAGRRLAALQEEGRQIERRRDELLREAATREQRSVERQAERDRLAGDLAAAETRLADLSNQAEELVAAATAQRSAAKEAREGVWAVEAEQQRVELEVRQLNARLEVLSRLAQTRDGLYPGVRAVMTAAKRFGSPLRGVVGIVASLVQAPPDLDAALEVALGGHLQDVVVECWKDAEAAIEWLKTSGAGRATFLPLDTIRQSVPVRVERGDGILGIASDLVQCDPAYRRVVDQLLGRTVVVHDMATARRLLKTARGEQIVTLAGEVIRPQGWVTGGSLKATGDGGLLAREREVRDLPIQIERLKKQLAKLASQANAGRAVEQAALEKADEIEARLRSLNGRHQEVLSEADRLSRLIERLDQQADWERDQSMSADQVAADVNARLAALAADLVVAEQALRDAELGGSAADRQVEELAAAIESARAAAATARARSQALAAEASAVRDRLGQHQKAIERLRNRLTGVAERGQEIAAARTAAAADRKRLSEERSGWVERRTAIERAISPLRAAVQELKLQLNSLVEEADALRGRLTDAERQFQRSNTQVDRVIADLARLRERAAADGLDVEIETDDPVAPLPPLLPSEAPTNAEADEDDRATHVFIENTSAISESGAVPMHKATAAAVVAAGSHVCDVNGNGLATHSTNGQHGIELGQHATNGAELRRAPSPASLLADAQLSGQISRLRAEIESLGPINPNALAEHAEIASRAQFMEEQLADLQQAEQSLRNAIAQLEGLVNTRFAEAFGLLSQEFSTAYSRLFAGGKASLILTDDDGERGIDVLAQPPGKRPASLAALSGGERALTGVALLFALLAVNPAPFCVLDEVDAALDETNVLRFGQALRELATQTQFLIVSHNRTMIEQASVLYGVTMSGDGVSRVLSLELSRALELADRTGTPTGA